MSQRMEELLTNNPFTILSVGDLIQGEVVKAMKHQVWLDLGEHGTGVVLGKELDYTTKKPEVGDVIQASVVDVESPNGFAILSLKKMTKEKGWEILDERFEKSEVFAVTPVDANKGGLIIEVEGVRGFLPVSQLSGENYPRVTGADKDEIQQRLNKLIGKVMMIRILDIDKKENKLIVSEKEAHKELTANKLAKLKVDDVVKAIVTGIVDFGVFVNIDGVEGLIHISEISWKRVDSPEKFVKIGQEVDAIIISIENNKLSLSMKRLIEDPWVKEVEKLENTQTITGLVTRVTPFGAFVKVNDTIEALVHVSELSNQEVKDPNDVISVGESKDFKIVGIDKEQHKLSLSLKS